MCAYRYEPLWDSALISLRIDQARRDEQTIPSHAETEKRLAALMTSAAGTLIGRSLGLGHPVDESEMSPEWQDVPKGSKGRR